MQSLSRDVWLSHILPFLPKRDLGHLAAVSKAFAQLTADHFALRPAAALSSKADISEISRVLTVRQRLSTLSIDCSHLSFHFVDAVPVVRQELLRHWARLLPLLADSTRRSRQLSSLRLLCGRDACPSARLHDVVMEALPAFTRLRSLALNAPVPPAKVAALLLALRPSRTLRRLSLRLAAGEEASVDVPTSLCRLAELRLHIYNSRTESSHRILEGLPSWLRRVLGSLRPARIALAVEGITKEFEPGRVLNLGPLVSLLPATPHLELQSDELWLGSDVRVPGVTSLGLGSLRFFFCGREPTAQIHMPQLLQLTVRPTGRLLQLVSPTSLAGVEELTLLDHHWDEHRHGNSRTMMLDYGYALLEAFSSLRRLVIDNGRMPLSLALRAESMGYLSSLHKLEELELRVDQWKRNPLLWFLEQLSRVAPSGLGRLAFRHTKDSRRMKDVALEPGPCAALWAQRIGHKTLRVELPRNFAVSTADCPSTICFAMSDDCDM